MTQTQTYAEAGTWVDAALENGRGLVVELDSGRLLLRGEELRATWEDLAPGEAFSVEIELSQLLASTEDALAAIEASGDADSMDAVFDARDTARDALTTLWKHVERHVI